MKVIKQGADPESRIWRGECLNCGCVMEANKNELVINENQRDGRWGVATCRTCKQDVNFYIKKG